MEPGRTILFNGRDPEPLIQGFKIVSYNITEDFIIQSFCLKILCSAEFVLSEFSL
jgi:hypothetical protein